MKNLFKISMLAAFAMAFAACSNDATEDVLPANPEVGTKTITVSVDAAMTRTTLNDAHTKLQWEVGDKFGYFANGTDAAANTAVEYTEGATEYTLTVPVDATEIYAYYPHYTNNDNTANTSAESVNLGMGTQKQSAGGVFDGYNYPMVAKATINGNNATLKFAPIASAIAFNVYNTAEDYAGGETVTSIKVTVEGSMISGRHAYDLTTGAYSNEEWNGYDNATVTLTEPVAVGTAKPADAQKYEEQIYLMLHKGTYTNATIVVTTDVNTYTFEGANLDCAEDIVPMNLNLSKGTTPVKKEYFAVTALDEIDVTATYVIGGNNEKTLADNSNMMMFTGTTSGWQCATTSAAFADNSFANNDIADVKLEAAGTANMYFIKVGNEYLCNTSTGTSSSDRSLSMLTSEPTAWTFVKKDGYEGFMFQNVIGTTTYEMGCNSTTEKSLRLYGNTTTPMKGAIYLFREVGTGGAITPKVYVSETELSLTADATAEPYPTFNVSVNWGNSLENVTMTNAATWLTAEFDKTTGVVTYYAEENTGAAERSATLNFAIKDGNNVDVVVKQAGYVASGVSKTVTMDSFSAISGNIDSVISYESKKGDGTTNPAINANCIKLYQPGSGKSTGGYITISAASGYKIQSITITTASAYAETGVQYAIDGGELSNKQNVAKSSDFTVDKQNASSIAFYCVGSSSNARLQIAKISVTYISE